MGTKALLLLFALHSNINNLPAGLHASVCYVESHYDPAAINFDDGRSSSLGLCQLKLSTAYFMGFRGTEAQLMDPKINIHFSSLYLRHQLHRYHGDVRMAISAYNAGTVKFTDQGKIKNQAYVDKVLLSWHSFNKGDQLK